jgi:tetratricopeptide (TPR) repeat protein
MEAVRIQPRFCVGYYTMGQALWHLQQLKDAEHALESAIGADPSCSNDRRLQGAWRLRGEVRARLGHRQDAVADLEKCVELDPYSNDGRMCQALLEESR